MPRINNGTLVTAGSSTGDWAAVVAASGPTAVSMERMDGTIGNCVSFTSATSTNLRFNYTPNINMSAVNTIEIEIYVHSPTGSAVEVPCDILLTNDSGFTNLYQFSTGNNGAAIPIVRGWNRVRLSRLDFGSSGSPAWTSAFDLLRFNITAVSGADITVRIGNIYIGRYARPKICFSFDDQDSTVYTYAYPLMDAAGIPGTNFVIGSYLDGSGTQGGRTRCTAAEIRTMNTAGWSAGNHTLTHQQNVLNAASLATCIAEIAGCTGIMTKHGIDDHGHFAAPYGEWSTNYLEAARQAGMTFYRGVIGDTTDAAGHVAIVSYNGQSNQLRPFTSYVLSSSTTSTHAIAAIDRAIAAGRPLMLVFHYISNGGASLECSESTFTAIVQGCVRRKAMADFVNLVDFIEALE